MHWLAEGDPLKLKAISEMPVIDFFVMLDKKVLETKKQKSKALRKDFNRNGNHH